MGCGQHGGWGPAETKPFLMLNDGGRSVGVRQRPSNLTDIAPTLQAALDSWDETAPRLMKRSAALDAGGSGAAFPFNPADCAAPLPRAYRWADGSAYVAHGGGIIKYSAAGIVLWTTTELAQDIVPDGAGGLFAGAILCLS